MKGHVPGFWKKHAGKQRDLDKCTGVWGRASLAMSKLPWQPLGVCRHVRPTLVLAYYSSCTKAAAPELQEYHNKKSLVVDVFFLESSDTTRRKEITDDTHQ